ncbi:hypothetical protein [Streptomyces sp. NRRL S-1824]|nr:hypothetical protein [Streptomyces sp. NRRL S-1824]
MRTSQDHRCRAVARTPILTLNLGLRTRASQMRPSPLRATLEA